MADWYACTWVDVRDCELKAEARRGIVPENPMADLLFNAVMVQVLEEIHKGSGEMSGCVMVPFAAGQNIGDVLRVVDCDDIAPVSVATYVDDLCLMVSREAKRVDREDGGNDQGLPTCIGQARFAEKCFQGQN